MNFFSQNLNNDKETSLEQSYSRLHVVMLVFIFIFILVGLKLITLTFGIIKTINNEKSTSQENYIRSDILDRNGTLLASSLTTESLYANPKILLDHKEAAHKLCEVLPDLNYNQLINEFSSIKNFVWIKRNLTPKEQYLVNNLGIPGLFFERGQKRIYPYKELLSHLIGYVGLDGKGLAGVEKYFDEELTKNDSSKPLNLTIDIRAQNIMHEELKHAMNEFKAIGAIGIIIDANNGEIISSVSLPDFDPHNPGQANSDQLFNRFSLGLYEPGSTFKAYTMTMALDTKTIELDDFYDVNAPIRAARFNITDYHAKGGLLSVPEIFMYSSNIGTAKIAMDLGKKNQQNLLKSYGLLEVIPIELPEKSTPIYPSESKWSDISTMTISYGHGIAITPMHMVRTMAAIINGGYLYDLTIKINEKPKIANRIIKEDTSKNMRKLFRLVVSEGTGRKANVKGYLVGGKTGTPNKTKKGGYHKNNRMSSFISGFPMNNPKYVVLVILDEPKGNSSTGGYATGGMTAAPVVGKIISRLGPLLNIQTIDENDHDAYNELYLQYNTVRDEFNSF